MNLSIIKLVSIIIIVCHYSLREREVSYNFKIDYKGSLYVSYIIFLSLVSE